jgi:hypothetical protein
MFQPGAVIVNAGLVQSPCACIGPSNNLAPEEVGVEDDPGAEVGVVVWDVVEWEVVVLAVDEVDDPPALDDPPPDVGVVVPPALEDGVVVVAEPAGGGSW